MGIVGSEAVVATMVIDDVLVSYGSVAQVMGSGVGGVRSLRSVDWLPRLVQSDSTPSPFLTFTRKLYEVPGLSPVLFQVVLVVHPEFVPAVVFSQ